MSGHEDEGTDAATVLNEGLWKPEFVPTSAIVIVTALDPESGREHLFWRTDGQTPLWKLVGMATGVCDDLRHALRRAGDD